MSYWLPLAAFSALPWLIKRGSARWMLRALRPEAARELVRSSLWWTYFAAPVGSGMLLLCNLLLFDKFVPPALHQRLHQASPLVWSLILWSPYLLLCLGFDLLAARRIPQSDLERRHAILWAWVANGVWVLGFFALIHPMLMWVLPPWRG